MTRASYYLKKLALVLAGLSLSFSLHAEEFVIKVKNTFTMQSLTSQLEQMNNIKVLDQHASGKLILIRTSDKVQEKDLENELKQFDSFEYLVPNVKFHINLSSDPEFSKQWSLEKVGASKAWKRSKNKARPIIAVIDTGVDYKHEDLSEQVLRNDKGEVKGWNFIENNNDPMDITKQGANPGHGTHCSGIIAATADNGKGVSGIAPNAWIMPLRFIGPDGSGDLMNSIKAIDFAIENGAQIISASWGAAVDRGTVKPLIEAIERAGQKGIVFVAAAANDGKSNDTREVYPANAGLANVISVAASDKNDAKPKWSNFGRIKVDLASPGAGILSTLPDNRYGELSGTSMATPLVAGLVALLLGQSSAEGKQFTAADFKALMQANSAKVQIETACNCRISADLAMSAIVENTLVVVPNAGTFESNTSTNFHAIGGQGPFHYTSSNTGVASITDDGQFKALSNGSTVITVSDANGKTASSHEIFVGDATPSQPPGGGGGPGNGQCPIQDPKLCDVICKLMPNAPWCKHLNVSSIAF